ncbi:hypothetical protein HanXRQr2_Chr12g0553271 [Helianthus annuus]|uniref:Uncharacterized protein n=1 Tax=Helianthus annuus TaxID=4232 RepID=A0A9K3HIE1_HELAN|nr:hypothetical protein HanXRQr2_Chr12g0553271 [Helianthus annuus]KAJ0863657.1 hypothetical protein HanPSC8_Chr12g0532601 [Helianthus annuus]
MVGIHHVNNQRIPPISCSRHVQIIIGSKLHHPLRISRIIIPFQLYILLMEPTHSLQHIIKYFGGYSVINHLKETPCTCKLVLLTSRSSTTSSGGRINMFGISTTPPTTASTSPGFCVIKSP